MIPKTLEQWNLEAIKNLLKKGYYETDSFDFKEMLPHQNNKDGKERLKKACCAFANSSGGFLVFGVKDDKDKKLTIDERLCGINPKESSDFPEKFGNYPSKCTPNIPWEFKQPAITLESGNTIQVIYIPKSFRSPHCIEDDYKFLFNKRTNKGNEKMSYEEISMHFLGFYEKRIKLNLLLAELNSIANDADVYSNFKIDGNNFSLTTFELNVINQVLTEIYSILANETNLLKSLSDLRKICLGANNRISIFYNMMGSRSLSPDSRTTIIIEHQNYMKPVGAQILTLAKNSITLLQKIITI